MRKTNFIADVTREICASPNGRRTINQLQKRFPRVTRAALQKALENAKDKGFIHLLLKGEMLGPSGGRAAGEWGPVPEWEMEPGARKRRQQITMPSPAYKPETVWVGGPPQFEIEGFGEVVT